MTKKTFVLALLFFVLGATGMSFFFSMRSTPSPVTNTNTTTSTTTQATTPIVTHPKLTLEMLKNASYYCDYCVAGTMVKLTNGTYQREPEPGDTASRGDYYDKLDETTPLFGDLNGDGWEDTIVYLRSRNGGSGIGLTVEAVLNENGKPHTVASISLGDRVTIGSAGIEDGIYTVNYAYGPGLKMEKYRLIGDKLVKQ